MRRELFCLLGLLLVAGQALRLPAQDVRIPSPVAPGYQPPPSALPYTSQGTVVAPPAIYPPALPPAAPFDPYAQPAQYVTTPAPPPTAVPYATAPAPPPISFPSLPDSWGGFYAGFEGTVLEARTGALSLPASTITLDSAAPIAIDSFDFQPDFDFEFSPRVWAGYKGAAGFGIRGRWWWYDHSGAGSFNIEDLPVGDAVDLDGIAPADSLALSLGSDLRFNVIDLEATQDGEFHNWDFQVAGGVRYAKIDYDLNGHIVGTINQGVVSSDFDGNLVAKSDFSGVGPTIAFSGRATRVLSGRARVFDDAADVVSVRRLEVELRDERHGSRHQRAAPRHQFRRLDPIVGGADRL